MQSVKPQTCIEPAKENIVVIFFPCLYLITLYRLGSYIKFFLKFKYSWFTVLHKFQVYRIGIQPYVCMGVSVCVCINIYIYIYIYVFFFRFPFLIGHFIILNIVLHSGSQLVIHFIHSNVYVYIIPSFPMYPSIYLP